MKQSVRQKMFEGIALWQESGLSQKAWCEKNEIRYSTFHYWYKRYRTEEAKDSNDSDFIRVMVNQGADGCWGELILPNGKKFIFRQPVGAEFLQTLLN